MKVMNTARGCLWFVIITVEFLPLPDRKTTTAFLNFLKEKLDNFLTVLYSLCSVVSHILQDSLTGPAWEGRSCYS